MLHIRACDGSGYRLSRCAEGRGLKGAGWPPPCVWTCRPAASGRSAAPPDDGAHRRLTAGGTGARSTPKGKGLVIVRPVQRVVSVHV